MGVSDAVIDQDNGENPSTKPKEKRKGKHDKPKPWDEDPNIDHWKIEKFDPSWNEGGMLEVSSFSTLFPQYRGMLGLPDKQKDQFLSFIVVLRSSQFLFINEQTSQCMYVTLGFRDVQ